MRHPPYHLRPNKAIDRLFLLEAIRRLDRLAPLAGYTYYGLGGPYLEDFRLLYEHCPAINLVSIEKNAETYRRQRFHLPCGTLRLEHAELESFVADFPPTDERGIYWLDYTGLEYGFFEDFMLLLEKVGELSLIKLSLRCQPRDYLDSTNQPIGAKAEEFRRKFGQVMPDPAATPPRSFDEFAALLQAMVRVAAQRALPSSWPRTFQPLSSFYYADAAGMFNITGVVCARGSQRSAVRKAYADLPFKNLTWRAPTQIDVPVLSTKERLHLEQFLPCGPHAGRRLRKELGYLVDRNRPATERQLKNYAEFHRYYPYFMRAVP